MAVTLLITLYVLNIIYTESTVGHLWFTEKILFV